MRLRHAILACLLIAAPVAGAQPDQGWISRQDAAWNQAFAAEDWKALRALYADDAWQISDRAPTLKGGDAIIANLQAYRQMRATVRFERENESVRIERPWAFVVQRYRMTAQMPGKAEVQTTGRALRIYRWRKGGWRLWREMDNTLPSR